MADNEDSTDRKLPKAAYGCARVFVAMFGLFAAALGIGGMVQIGGGWWAFLFWFVMLGFGVCLLWTSVFGKRESVDHILTEFLGSILEKLF
jgi:membrane protein implicated in regulation of membrane protease activity